MASRSRRYARPAGTFQPVHRSSTIERRCSAEPGDGTRLGTRLAKALVVATLALGGISTPAVAAEADIEGPAPTAEEEVHGDVPEEDGESFGLDGASETDLVKGEESEGAQGDLGDEVDGGEPDAGFPPGDYAVKPLAKGVARLSGSNRYATAIAVAKRVTDGTGEADAVFVASGASYADGLTVGALAGYVGAPVLLTKPKTLPAEVAAQVRALKPKRIVVAGGEGAVSRSVWDALQRSAPAAEMERIGGATRYETAALIAEKFPEGAPAFLATGRAFPDALGSSGAAAKVGGFVLLTPGFKTSPLVNEVLQKRKTSSVYIVGGKWKADDLASVRSHAGLEAVTHLAGSDRYETSAKVAEQFWQAPSTTIYSTGKAYPDAMVGVSVSKAFDAPILLTPGGCRGKAVAKVGVSQSRVVLLGGAGVVSQHVYDNTCIAPSKLRAAPTYRGGTYSFNIAWSGQQTSYWCGPASAYMVLKRLGWSKSVSGVALSQAALASNSYIETQRHGRTLWPGNYLGKGIERWTGNKLYRQEKAPSAAVLRQRVLDSFLKTGRPVMLHETLKTGRLPINGRTSRDGTHVLVVNSYNPSTDTLTVLDAAAGVVKPEAKPSFTIKVSDMAGYLKELGIYY